MARRRASAYGGQVSDDGHQPIEAERLRQQRPVHVEKNCGHDEWRLDLGQAKAARDALGASRPADAVPKGPAARQ